MDLIIWRHAEAEDKSEDLPDLERKLTRRGVKQAARIGEWLASRLPAGTRVLCSPALRCQQTALGLGRKFEIVQELAPDAEAQAVLQAAGWPQGSDPVVIVGHQPTLGEAVARLLAIQGGHCRIEKAALWWLRTREVDGRQETAVRTVQSPDLV